MTDLKTMLEAHFDPEEFKSITDYIAAENNLILGLLDMVERQNEALVWLRDSPTQAAFDYIKPIIKESTPLLKTAKKVRNKP